LKQKHFFKENEREKAGLSRSAKENLKQKKKITLTTIQTMVKAWTKFNLKLSRKNLPIEKTKTLTTMVM
jgi:hypothetical protein